MEMRLPLSVEAGQKYFLINHQSGEEQSTKGYRLPKQSTAVFLFESDRYEAGTRNMPEQLKGRKQLEIFLYPSYYSLEHNAALRGECRTNQVSADHFHHLNSPHTQNATRHESHLNALYG